MGAEPTAQNPADPARKGPDGRHDRLGKPSLPADLGARARLAARIETLSTPEPNTGCVLWLGELNDGGYGKVWNGERKVFAHRAAYEFARGAIPPDRTLDHLCRVRCCLNPLHLEAVPPRTNTLRSTSPSALNAAKDACERGHALAGENLYVSADGHRHCRTCTAAASREHYLRNRATVIARTARRKATQRAAGVRP